METRQLVVVTDLDGCVLNKHDYDFAPAVPVLQRAQRAKIPVVLSSSKTEAEMTVIADELGLADLPLVCENGGVVIWRAPGEEASHQILGVERAEIRNHLDSLRERFDFRSFSDLGVEGVMGATDLPRDNAARACDRHCTEPLLFDGPAGGEADFRAAIESGGLTLTRGGRFWHVAGHTTKGAGMAIVLKNYALKLGECSSVAIGDSPIDQSMLDIADFPIAIPQPSGEFLATTDHNANGIRAEKPGAAGWAQAVSDLFDRLGVPG